MKRFLAAVFLLVIVGGAFLAGSWYGQREDSKNIASGSRRILYYVDPMHPAYKSDKPGIAPDCGMELVPVYDDSSMGGPGGGPAGSPPGTVRVSADKQQLIGIRTGVVEKATREHALRILGRVAADETRVYRIYASVDGWIRETYPNSVGALVTKDEVLATFYSPQFLDAQQSYLYALGAVDRGQLGSRLELGRKEAPAQMALDQLTVQRFTDNLRGLGMPDTQIEEIGRTRQVMYTIRLAAPAAGFITARNVSPGQRFLKGTELFQIADLSRVWILADAYENEAQHLKPGIIVKASVPNQQRTFHAKVTHILPQFDGTTRTLKVRLEADNPGFVLRPDMFMDLEVPVARPAAITVPADAVVDSGVKKTVYVEKGDGVFEPRRVETGWRAGDQVEIVKGLMVGEKIVVSGTFLLDSESRMKAAAAGFYGETSEDPVCGMDVDQSKAKAAGRAVEYKGQTYYFCSDDCKEKFGKEPTRYTWKSNPGPVTPAGKRLSEVQWEGGKAKESANVGHMHPPAPSAGKSSSR